MDDSLRLLAICNYPSDTNPTFQVFIRTLFCEMASLGVDITVLAAESLGNLTKKGTGFRLAPRFERRDGLPIHRPRCLTFSALSLPLSVNTLRWSFNACINTVSREAKRIKGPFDMCLGYFLYPHGLAAVQVAEALGIPAAVILGESSNLRFYETIYSQIEIGQLLEKFAGVITNSPVATRRCIERYGLSETKIRTFPNGVDERHFFPRDRRSARQRCRLPLDRPLVAFVGRFIESKGPLRVLEAIKSRPEIGAIFLGQGPQVPGGPQVLYRGEVLHEDMPIWLSAIDIFVLPTLNEGCSNAILEALFCGLPVISSDLPFNHSILDDQVAVLVDPRDVRELAQAISSLVDDSARMQAMSQAALHRAQSFRLSDRAKRILAFLKTF
jgi:glycosyltransferase involved in cell wall biosynthesis